MVAHDAMLRGVGRAALLVSSLSTLRPITPLIGSRAGALFGARVTMCASSKPSKSTAAKATAQDNTPDILPSSMKVAELRDALAALGEDTIGKKAELLSRLEAARAKGAVKKQATKRNCADVDGSGASGSPQRKAKGVALELAPPKGWRLTYDLITELRADRSAVVDTMGSEALAEGAGSGTSVAERDYHTLVSLMLSSQTKDTVNAATMIKLREHGLTVDNILATDDATLDELIHAVGFHNNKVFHNKAFQSLQLAPCLTTHCAHTGALYQGGDAHRQGRLRRAHP